MKPTYTDDFLTRWGGRNWFLIRFHGERVREWSWGIKIGPLHLSSSGMWWNSGGDYFVREHDDTDNVDQQ